jgi:hypothetical protein
MSDHHDVPHKKAFAVGAANMLLWVGLHGSVSYLITRMCQNSRQLFYMCQQVLTSFKNNSQVAGATAQVRGGPTSPSLAGMFDAAPYV